MSNYRTNLGLKAIIRRSLSETATAVCCHMATSGRKGFSGTLLKDQTTASITSYFHCVVSKLGLLHKTTCPSFVVIDFSLTLLNSVTDAFNVGNIHS